MEAPKDAPIDATKSVEEIRKEPYKLPPGYAWCAIDVGDAAQLTELFTLLRDNYVEDTDASFRFKYSAEFLLWALTPPGHYKDWHVGLRRTDTGALVASIVGVPATVHVKTASMRMCEINFLCVHKSLRSMRLAPVLIKEVTRRVNLTGACSRSMMTWRCVLTCRYGSSVDVAVTPFAFAPRASAGIFQATYTAGVKLPSPLTSAQYYHRSLNSKKLVEIGFSHIGARMTLSRTMKLYALPEVGAIRTRQSLVCGATVCAGCVVLSRCTRCSTRCLAHRRRRCLG